MNAAPLLTCHVVNHVASVNLNRPQKRNALTRALLTELLATLKRLERQADLRLLVLSASGSAFCAGMDLVEMQETARSPDAGRLWSEDAQLYREVVASLYALPMPTLAVVQGPAVAGGCGLVLACDLVLASTKASFALPEPKRGITAAVVTPLLSLRLGPGSAGYLLLSGRSVDAATALRLGLCHELVEADDLPAARENLVSSILGGSPAALAISKRQLQTCSGVDVLAQLEQAAIVSGEARNTDDAREGLQAFLEKRPPRWAP